MLPIGINVKLLNNIVNELRNKGLWAERHSYSIRIMYNGKFAASLHIYPGFNEAVLRLYGDEESNGIILSWIKELFRKYLASYSLKVIYISRPQ